MLCLRNMATLGPSKRRSVATASYGLKASSAMHRERDMSFPNSSTQVRFLHLCDSVNRKVQASPQEHLSCLFCEWVWSKDNSLNAFSAEAEGLMEAAQPCLAGRKGNWSCSWWTKCIFFPHIGHRLIIAHTKPMAIKSLPGDPLEEAEWTAACPLWEGEGCITLPGWRIFGSKKSQGCFQFDV